MGQINKKKKTNSEGGDKLRKKTINKKERDKNLLKQYTIKTTVTDRMKREKEQM